MGMSLNPRVYGRNYLKPKLGAIDKDLPGASVLSRQLGVNSVGGFLGGTALFAGLSMMEGEPLGTSLVKGAAENLLWEFAPGGVLAYEILTNAPNLGVTVAERARQQGRWWNQMHRANFGGGYKDTQQALTMRQAAVQAISGSKMNARSALGGEARLMHRPYYSS